MTERYVVYYKYKEAPRIEPACHCEQLGDCTDAEEDPCFYSWEEAVKSVVDWHIEEITRLRYMKPEEYFGGN